MTEKFKIIESGINVTPYIDLLEKNESDWDSLGTIPGIRGITNLTGCIPLTLGNINLSNYIDIDDVEEQRNTPYYSKYELFVNFMYDRGFKNHGRCGLFRLMPGQMNATHSENGVYYDKRNRYHFAVSGSYELIVDNEAHIINPGVLFVFNNKLPHSAESLSDDIRISFVFDVLDTIKYIPPVN